MGSIGMSELMVILVIVLIIFSAGKLPQMGENLGKAIRNFKKSTQEKEDTHTHIEKSERDQIEIKS